jgi:hypothetical protein
MRCFGAESSQMRAAATGSVVGEGGGLLPTQGGGPRARLPEGARS